MLASRKPAESEAIEQAKRLIGAYWAHTKPDDPPAFLQAIAGALSDYPLMLVEECCDARTGHARRSDRLPSVFSVITWCDERLGLYRAVAASTKRGSEKKS